METCLALGVVFATLAIPLGLGSQWTTSAWAVEGAAVFWLGLRQQRRLAQVFGLLLQLGASAILISDSSTQAFASDYWTPMILAVAALISAWCVFHFNAMTLMAPNHARAVLVIWGALWWMVSLVSAVDLYASARFQTAALLIALALSVAHDNPAASGGWLAWSAVFIVHLLTLRHLAELQSLLAKRVAHTAGCLLLLCVLALELRSSLLQLSEYYNAWRWLGWAILPSLFLLAMSSGRDWPWPVRACPEAYHVGAAAPLAILMLAWFWLANLFSDGAAAPLLLNPLENRPVAGAGRRVPVDAQVPAAQAQSHSVAGRRIAVRTGHGHGHAHRPSLGRCTVVQRGSAASMRVQAGLSIVWTLMALA